MTQERLTLKKIREIIRLKYDAGLSNRAIVGTCKVFNSTVCEYLRRAKAAGVGWPIGEMGEEELFQKLYPENQTIEPEFKDPMPDWDQIKKEKRPKGCHPEAFVARI